jgi:hypothetical protein
MPAGRQRRKQQQQQQAAPKLSRDWAAPLPLSLAKFVFVYRLKNVSKTSAQRWKHCLEIEEKGGVKNSGVRGEMLLLLSWLLLGWGRDHPQCWLSLCLNSLSKLVFY